MIQPSKFIVVSSVSLPWCPSALAPAVYLHERDSLAPLNRSAKGKRKCFTVTPVSSLLQSSQPFTLKEPAWFLYAGPHCTFRHSGPEMNIGKIWRSEALVFVCF